MKFKRLRIIIIVCFRKYTFHAPLTFLKNAIYVQDNNFIDVHLIQVQRYYKIL